jgi:hypothetical protein
MKEIWTASELQQWVDSLTDQQCSDVIKACQDRFITLTPDIIEITHNNGLIQGIKAWRQKTGLGLKEATDLFKKHGLMKS